MASDRRSGFYARAFLSLLRVMGPEAVSLPLSSGAGAVAGPRSDLQDRGEGAGQVIGRRVTSPLRAPAYEPVGPDQHGAVALDPV